MSVSGPTSKTKTVLTLIMGIIIFTASARYAIELYRTNSHLNRSGSIRRPAKSYHSLATQAFEGKASGLFRVESHVVTESTGRRLRLYVRANQDVTSAHLKWILPAGTKILTGRDQIEIESLRRGDERSFEILVDSLGDHAGFAEIFTDINGFKMGATAPFSETPMKTVIRPNSLSSRDPSPKLFQ